MTSPGIDLKRLKKGECIYTHQFVPCMKCQYFMPYNSTGPYGECVMMWAHYYQSGPFGMW